MDRYKDCSLGQLREELKRRKARVSGRKKDLICRLEYLDSIQEPGQNPVEDEVEEMALPDATSFKDLHGGMTIPTPRLDEYLELYEKSFENKSKDMYNERFLRTVRTCTHHGYVYFESQMWAEMKKSTSYKLHVKLSPEGVVEEAQCECGAGRGPAAHCKHIACLLYGIGQFCRKHHILTEMTCTQKLQTFHQARPFKGSPMKASLIVKNEALHFDPRPQHLRNHPSYPDNFRNACINFSFTQKSAHTKSMPVMQLFPPANLHAFCLDHDYLELTAEDEFLQTHMVSQITADQAAKMEQRTRGQSTNSLWKETRSMHITSSNFGKICKATERRNMVALVTSLTDMKEIRTPSIIHGRKYEDVAVEKYASKTGTSPQPCGIFISTSEPMLAASPDRVLDSDTLIEVKCPFCARNQLINPVTVPYLELKEGKLVLKDNHDYYYQIQGQLFCSGRRLCVLIVYTFKDLVSVLVPRDDSFIENMIHTLKVFYENYFRPAIINKYVYKDYYRYAL